MLSTTSNGWFIFRTARSLRQKASLSDQAGASFLKPGDVGIVWRGSDQFQIHPLLDRRLGPWIEPSSDLRMAVGERQAASSNMITCRAVDERQRRWLSWAEPFHVDHEEAVVDSVFAFVENY